VQQIIFGGSGHIPSDTDTQYNSLFGGLEYQANTDRVYQVVAAPGSISKLLIHTQTHAGDGKSRTFTLYKNGAVTPLSVTITGDGVTLGEDVDNEVTVSAGDRICIQHVPANTPTVSIASWAILFTGTNAGESLLLSNGESTLSNAFSGYLPLASGGARFSAAGSRNQPVPTPGKFTKFYCHLTSAPDPAGAGGYRVSLQVNGADSDDGSGNPLRIDITGDNVSGNDARDITVAAGDLVRVKVEPTGDPAVEPYLHYGFCFVSDTDGESIILGNTSDPLHDTNTEYNCLACWSILPFSTEGNRKQVLWTMTLKNFYVWIKDAPGADKSYTFTLRIASPVGGAGAATSVVVSIAGGDQTGNDTVNEATFSDYDGVAFEVDPDSSPTVASATSIGIVGYIEGAPPAAGGGIGSEAQMAVAMGMI